MGFLEYQKIGHRDVIQKYPGINSAFINAPFWSLGLIDAKFCLRTRRKWGMYTNIPLSGNFPILWPPDAVSWFIEKDPNAMKQWGQEEKGVKEDEMTGWHHRLNEHKFEQTPGDGEGQGSLACCSPWGCKESDMTEQLNNINY